MTPPFDFSLDPESLARDPAFYAQDIHCAIADMAERFPREALIAAVSEALKPLQIEAIDLIGGLKNAA